MRRPGFALFSGIGRQIAQAALAGGLVVLVIGLLLQAGKQQRQYRDLHQQQLRQAAAQMAALARGGLDIDALRRIGNDAGSSIEYALVGPNQDTGHIRGYLGSRLDSLPATGVTDLAWNEGGEAWVGAMSRVRGKGTSSSTLALVAMDRDRPWSVAFWSALRTQSTGLVLLLALAAWLGHSVAAPQVGALRQLRRALAQLGARRVAVTGSPQLVGEVRQLVDAYNRSADAIETQQAMRRALDEIDALLLRGGDYESVLDQVLAQVRGVTHAHNVGLTLLDPGAAGHGRLFVVNAGGGAPVNRIVLDDQMVETLRGAGSGLTVARCEQGRHSFLDPLQAAGSAFFWVWPVMAADELAAILAVGYAEPPPQAARIADTGMLCAQHLGHALSSSARAERLYRQANYDPLTQLPNRQLFNEQLQAELRDTIARDGEGALLYVDLDHFKRVNDSLGHEAGDQLLTVVAQRLRNSVRECDIVARLGGDEFTIILRDINSSTDVAAVAEDIIAAMRSPVRVGGRDHYVHASIGITLFPTDGSEPEELLRRADLAMYAAKDVGRGAAMFYSSKLAGRSATVADSGLYRAMKRREFSLYFQPQYRVSDGDLVGVEALLRWQNPREGMKESAGFIPAAEECGIIVDLGGWVIEAACAQIAQWRESGMPVPRVAINLSQQQLRDPELVPGLRRQMERFGVSTQLLEFEMSEATLTDPESAACIEALADLGVALVLDDFGTGSTALANLRRYPVGSVKIDRSFVEQLSDEPSAAALADTIIVMAHAMGKRVVAEGVETIEQLDYLREHGCDAAQGYFMAQPMSAQDMTSLLAGFGQRTRTSRSAIA